MCAPEPRTMNGGSPPTERNARAGEFTPPGNNCSARACSLRERSILRIRTLILVDGALQPCPRACGQSSMGDALGYLAGLCTTAANVPQVLTTFRRKSGDGLS